MILLAYTFKGRQRWRINALSKIKHTLPKICFELFNKGLSNRTLNSFRALKHTAAGYNIKGAW
jgi:hypothetical protein